MVALFIVIDPLEGGPHEDVFVPPEDADPVKEPAAAVGEVEDSRADDQEFQKFRSPWPRLEECFVPNSVDVTNANVLLLWCAACYYKETMHAVPFWKALYLI